MKYSNHLINIGSVILVLLLLFTLSRSEGHEFEIPGTWNGTIELGALTAGGSCPPIVEEEDDGEGMGDFAADIGGGKDDY